MNNIQNLQILYEDNHIIAINKPSKVLSQRDITGDDPIGEQVKQYIKAKYAKPGDVFLGVVHRLDRPTSGILLFARTSKALTRLNEMLQKKEIEKTYLAIVQQPPPLTNGKLIHHLIRLENKNITKALASPQQQSKEAILKYRLLDKSNNFFLLEIKPETGRQHQIRVQLSAIGSPIVGDIKYGYKQPNEDASICLHAYQLHFIHPVKKEPVTIKVNPSAKNAWQYFNLK